MKASGNYTQADIDAIFKDKKYYQAANALAAAQSGPVYVVGQKDPVAGANASSDGGVPISDVDQDFIKTLKWDPHTGFGDRYYEALEGLNSQGNGRTNTGVPEQIGNTVQDFLSTRHTSQDQLTQIQHFVQTGDPGSVKELTDMHKAQLQADRVDIDFLIAQAKNNQKIATDPKCALDWNSAPDSSGNTGFSSSYVQSQNPDIPSGAYTIVKVNSDYKSEIAGTDGYYVLCFLPDDQDVRTDGYTPDQLVFSSQQAAQYAANTYATILRSGQGNLDKKTIDTAFDAYLKTIPTDQADEERGNEEALSIASSVASFMSTPGKILQLAQSVYVNDLNAIVNIAAGKPLKYTPDADMSAYTSNWANATGGVDVSAELKNSGFWGNVAYTGLNALGDPLTYVGGSMIPVGERNALGLSAKAMGTLEYANALQKGETLAQRMAVEESAKAAGVEAKVFGTEIPIDATEANTIEKQKIDSIPEEAQPYVQEPADTWNKPVDLGNGKAYVESSDGRFAIQTANGKSRLIEFTIDNGKMDTKLIGDFATPEEARAAAESEPRGAYANDVGITAKQNRAAFTDPEKAVLEGINSPEASARPQAGEEGGLLDEAAPTYEDIEQAIEAGRANNIQKPYMAIAQHTDSVLPEVRGFDTLEEAQSWAGEHDGAKIFKTSVDGEKINGLEAVGEAGKAPGGGEMIRSENGSSIPKKYIGVEVREFPNKLLKTKPKYSPTPKKWIEDGGRITIDENGIWTYHDSEENSLSYRNGYPDFKSAKMVKQEIKLGEFKSYNKDFAEADGIAEERGQPREDTSTWHHNEDMKTLQEIDQELHDRFTHIGGMSLAGIK